MSDSPDDRPPDHRTMRMVLGILPKQFEHADAPAIIAIAAASTLFTAALGNDDPEMCAKVAQRIGEMFRRMRPEARTLLLNTAAEFLDAIKQGKGFMVIGEFRDDHHG